MNFFRQLLVDRNTQTNFQEPKSPEQSGQFQLLEDDNQCNQNKNVQQLQDIIKKDTQTMIDHVKQNKSLNEIIREQTQIAITQQEKENFINRISKQYAIIDIDEQQLEEQMEKISNQNCRSASTIKIDQYYMIVAKQQLKQKFTSQQQWKELYNRIKKFNKSGQCDNKNDKIKSSKSKISLNLQQLNSILQIKSKDLNRRLQFWNKIGVPSVDIKFKYTQLCNKKDPQKLNKNVKKIMEKLASQIIYQIAEHKYKNISNVSEQNEIWSKSIIQTLTNYGANDKQIGYSKGMQYVALGILVARPFQYIKQTQQAKSSSQQKQFLQSYANKSQQIKSCQQVKQYLKKTIQQTKTIQYAKLNQQSNQIQYEMRCKQNNNNVNGQKLLNNQTKQQYVQYELEKHFKYLMFTKQLRKMYFPGTPILYEEVKLLQESVQIEVSQLYKRLVLINADFLKIFINYYKAFMLYNLKNPQAVRKIMDLLLIYGIDIVRVLLTRIMNKNERNILAKQDTKLLKYVAEDLIVDYFGVSLQQEIIFKFKQLFILDVQK